MPRAARIKSTNSIYHIMVRSIDEVSLFNHDQDKDKYLSLIKKYQDTFHFKVYAFCIMSNHGHFIIDSNGADISKLMHCINQCYAQYFNKKHKRRGHLFHDRFKSIVVADDSYLIALSQYIHCNPKDIWGYENKVEHYKYSSLGIYLRLWEDELSILDTEFINGIYDIGKEESKKEYLDKVYKSTDSLIKTSVEFEDEKCEYRSERVIIARNRDPEMIIQFISRKTGVPKDKVTAKYSKKSTLSKALFIFLMRSICGYTYKDICGLVGNLTQGRVSSLSSFGMETIYGKYEYKGLLKEFLAG